MALTAHQALGLRDLSRSDLIVDADGPGMVPRGQRGTGLHRDLDRATRHPGRRPGSRQGLRFPRPGRRRAEPAGVVVRDLTYPAVIATAKTRFRLLGQRFQMTGTENVPRSGGVLLAYNHIGYVDFVYGGLATQPSRRLVRFMAKREIFDHPVGGAIMRSLHHIEVDRGEGLGRTARPWSTCRPARPSGSSLRRRSPARWSSRSSRTARRGSRPRRGCPSCRSSSGAPSG